MTLGQFLKDDLIKVNLECENREQLFEILAKEALKQGYVTDQFLTKVIERESVFPTGLCMNNYNVAIPHTDPEFVKEQFIAVATLKKPVSFQLMDDKTKESDVNVVLMLGLNEPHSQLTVLQQIMQIIQDGSKIEQMLLANNIEDIYTVFNQMEENN
ncbi:MULTISPECIES: PTS sugar transporter subunit IIA [Heyndrickxia]|uniref:PTS sugar transporter subunit IIA n=1 Tax=Heyndrickxia sporothermodurans TaxID=46224 RepID=A0A150KJU6_9BACI|nr:PTS sugar transporter subunit IIA [Heyndrickxia sporothermodurans]KYC84195.1 PTS system, galactitol-specific IIA component [Heyndrickxia sporothermodurans]MBL5772840.1 PTS sugar transporter subunit IIA [Heyndrickxia sporothermodurans]MBL5775574.1 PTS sugar transporter subunit IIA [Heyndrickxia sporothermodurans]MBL5779025.1 PTS sugar transporter subunit IIA [Heyndrickxia sporothermodurans]MBL5782848.1 PTS sugar transporter subunit IIA [Heyndrickxia sporothermodurans]